MKHAFYQILFVAAHLSFVNPTLASTPSVQAISVEADSVHLKITAPDQSMDLVVLVSGDLQNWDVLGVPVALGNEQFDFEVERDRSEQQFYRVVYRYSLDRESTLREAIEEVGEEDAAGESVRLASELLLGSPTERSTSTGTEDVDDNDEGDKLGVPLPIPYGASPCAQEPLIFVKPIEIGQWGGGGNGGGVSSGPINGVWPFPVPSVTVQCELGIIYH